MESFRDLSSSLFQLPVKVEEHMNNPVEEHMNKRRLQRLSSVHEAMLPQVVPRDPGAGFGGASASSAWAPD
eukprot:838703-Alexandrium_andersonii.AAC.1